MKKSTKILLTILTLAVIVGALLVVWQCCSPGTTQGQKAIMVEVAHLDGTQNSFELHTDAEYLAPALEAEDLISGSQGDYGLFIDTVDGEYADPQKNQWWIFTVNGEMGMYGADTQPIEDGDCFAFSIYEG